MNFVPWSIMSLQWQTTFGWKTRNLIHMHILLSFSVFGLPTGCKEEIKKEWWKEKSYIDMLHSNADDVVYIMMMTANNKGCYPSIWIILHEIENSILMLWNENDIRKQSSTYRISIFIFFVFVQHLGLAGYHFFDRWHDIEMKFDKKKKKRLWKNGQSRSWRYEGIN